MGTKIDYIEEEKCEKLEEKLEKTAEFREKAEFITEKPEILVEKPDELQKLTEVQRENKERKSFMEAKKTPKSIPSKRKLEDGSKQACLDEYFLEKPQLNENSAGFIVKSITKPSKLPKSPFPVEKLVFKENFPAENAQLRQADLERELRALKEILAEKDRESKEKERILKILSDEKMRYKEIHENFIEDFLGYKNQVQKLLSNYLLECERYKKNEIKTHLSSQRHRLGEYISQRNGSRFEDIWVDGYELRNLKELVSKIAGDKEELKNKKKGLKKDEKEKEITSQRIKILTSVNFFRKICVFCVFSVFRVFFDF